MRPGPNKATVNSGVANNTQNAANILFKSPAKNAQAHAQLHKNPTAAGTRVYQPKIKNSAQNSYATTNTNPAGTEKGTRKAVKLYKNSR